MFFDNSSPWKELDFPPLLTSKSTQTRPQVFYVNGSIVCNFVALLTSSVQYGNASWLWCDFSHWETETYFEWIIMSLTFGQLAQLPSFNKGFFPFFSKPFLGTASQQMQGPAMFKCFTGDHFIWDSHRCNGIFECPDGSDETGCADSKRFSTFLKR